MYKLRQLHSKKATKRCRCFNGCNATDPQRFRATGFQSAALLMSLENLKMLCSLIDCCLPTRPLQSTAPLMKNRTIAEVKRRKDVLEAIDEELKKKRKSN